MSLGEGSKSSSIDQKLRNVEDPVAKAIRSGKAPTNKDVKMSLKVLSLILSKAPPAFSFCIGLIEDFNAFHASYGGSA